MTTKQQQTILCGSLQEFVFTIDELRRDGWEFDPDMPPIEYAFKYECGLIRNASEQQIQKDQAIEGKPSRAEILAKARAAKAAKKEVSNV